MEKVALIYKNKIYSYDGKRLTLVDVKDIKRTKVGGVINSKDVITFSFKLPKNIPQDQLGLKVELKMYKEGGLNPDKSYKIDFITYDLDGEEELIVEAYAVEYNKLGEFSQFAQRIGFIDIIFPRFIAYEAYYKYIDKEEHYTNDVIFYIGEEESFAAIYKEGVYIGYRIMDDIKTIAKKSGIDPITLKTYLKTKGFKSENYSEDERSVFNILLEIFSKNIEKIVYAINFKRTYFSIDRIDRVLIDFEGSFIEGIETLFYSSGFYDNSKFEIFECCGKKEQSEIYLLAHYVFLYENLPYKLNFTIFKRKKPFYKYNTFKIFVAVLVYIILLMASYIYLSYQKSSLDAQIDEKKSRLNSLKAKNKKVMKEIEKLKREKSRLLAFTGDLENEIEIFENTLEVVPFIQKTTIEREKIINDVVEALYISNLSTKKIEQNGTKRVVVDIVSKSKEGDKISNFMKYLYKLGYKNVNTDSIVKKENYYNSQIRIER